MFFDQPQIFHSQREDGRHWLTSMDFPPLQILPVAGNQCRVAHALAMLLCARLAAAELELPCELTLTRADLEAAPDFAHRYNALRVRREGVPLRLEMRGGPGREPGDEAADDDVEFITPVPPAGWPGSYDQWLYQATSALGMEPPEPMPHSAYARALADAIAQARNEIPALRQRFLQGMDGLNLGLKIGLKTGAGGTEYVWTRPIDWSDPDMLICILESQPYECEGYEIGQRLALPLGDIVDYGIGSEEAGLVEPGYTQRIAEDYGEVVG